MSSISKAIAKSQAEGGNSKQVDALERQVDAAEFFGQIAPDKPTTTEQKRPRGRPPTKSKSPGPSQRGGQNIPDEFPKASKPKVDFQGAIHKMNRTRLLTKIRAYHAYWPDICPLSGGEFMMLDNAQLQELIDTFEMSVNSYSEIVDIPQGVKAAICNIESTALSIGSANSQDPFLSKGLLMGGFSQAVLQNPDIDRNVKLVSIRLLGRLPSNPYISLLYHICTTAYRVMQYNATVKREPVPEEYKEL